jgi:hypothetical protein
MSFREDENDRIHGATKMSEHPKDFSGLFPKASDKQVGGNHYKQFAIQPAEFCHKNNIPYLEATAIKYLCRWREKGGIEDLNKAIHFIELLKEFESDVKVIKLSGEKNVTSTF